MDAKVDVDNTQDSRNLSTSAPQHLSTSAHVRRQVPRRHPSSTCSVSASPVNKCNEMGSSRPNIRTVARTPATRDEQPVTADRSGHWFLSGLRPSN
ncbi:hypothetical protein ColTof3_01253 [Colletotrichum tofieldiae]|nr:hypothetical protein ColTof3_01253 [Colletotrichum tofieldiae]